MSTESESQSIDELPKEDFHEEEGVICYQHCRGRFYALASKTSTTACPSCSKLLADCQFDVPPVRLPSPYRRAKDCPMSLVIRPSKHMMGFGHGDLHVGVTDSGGRVHEFVSGGARFVEHSHKWDKSITVNVTDHDTADKEAIRDPDFASYWDSRLLQLLSRAPWRPSDRAYHQERLNCLDFCLAFLGSLPELGRVSQVARSGTKVDFCKVFVLPELRRLAKYVALVEKLKRNGGIVSVRDQT